jgi:hypothetical protein
VAVASMSKQEFSRLDALLQVQSGRLRVTDARLIGTLVPDGHEDAVAG